MSAVAPELHLTRDQKITLLKVARQTIAAVTAGKIIPKFDFSENIFQEKRGAFVTLHKNHELRGCIGYVIGYSPLLATVQEMAEAAAMRDPRFSPVKSDEVNDLEIEISVLSPLRKIKNMEEIEIGVHGIMLEKYYKTGLLLPQVATEYGWDRVQFLQHTCLKAGLHKDAWDGPETTIQIFSADVFCEKDLLFIDKLEGN